MNKSKLANTLVNALENIQVDPGESTQLWCAPLERLYDECGLVVKVAHQEDKLSILVGIGDELAVHGEVSLLDSEFSEAGLMEACLEAASAIAHEVQAEACCASWCRAGY